LGYGPGSFYVASSECRSPRSGKAGGDTVGAALADVFARHPAVKSYILDDQDRLRTHIAVFVDGVHVRREILDYPLKSESEVYILQALSGG